MTLELNPESEGTRVTKILVVVVAVIAPSVVPAAEISFKDQIAPVLVRRCLGCHNNRKAEGRYVLTTFEMLVKPGESDESPIVPGKPDESYLIQKLVDPDADLRMPQEDDPLTPDQIEMIRQWIKAGSDFDGKNRGDRLVTMLPPRVHPQPPETYRVSVPVFGLRFSVDGERLFTAGVHELLVWGVRTGKLEQRVSGLPQRIHAIEFSPDGSTLAVAGGAPGDYGEIHLLAVSDSDAISAEHKVTLAVWEDVVLAMAFTHDGRHLVAGGADNSLRAYELPSGQEQWQTRQHVDWVTDVDVTDYRFTETHVSNDGIPDFFKLNANEKASGSHVRQHWQFPDGSYLVRAGTWELEVGAGDVKSLTDITITGIGKTRSVKRTTRMGDSLQASESVITFLKSLHDDWGSLSPGQSFVISSSRDRTVKASSLGDGGLFTTYKGHRREYGPLKGMHRVYDVQTEPQTRRVWSAGEGLHLHGWNPVTVRDEDGTAADMESRFAKAYSVDHIRHDFRDHIFRLVHADSRLFAAAADGQVKEFAIHGPQARFDPNNVSTLRTLAGHSDFLFSLDVNNGLVAAAGYSGEVVIWDTSNGEVLNRFVAAP